MAGERAPTAEPSPDLEQFRQLTEAIPEGITAALFSAFSMVTHAGQGCALTSRLLVPEQHKDEIVELIKNNFGLVRYGDPADPKTYMGPLISEKQRDKVDGMVQRAIRRCCG